MANRFYNQERWRQRDERDFNRDYDDDRRRFSRWGDYDAPRRRGSGYQYNPEGFYVEPPRRHYGSEGYYGEPIRRGYDYDELGWQGYYGEPTWRGYGGEDYYRRFRDWRVDGPYMGRGPKGYQRSDERICEDVCERLTQHGQIDASDIEVEVNNTEVTLKGTVDSREVKRWAEDVADFIPGVTDVHNHLRVGDSGRFRERSDAPIGRSQVQTGMDVIGAGGEKIGRVKEVRASDFLLDRPLARDVYIPFEACRMISANEVILNVLASEVDNQDWPNPELIETASPLT